MFFGSYINVAHSEKQIYKVQFEKKKRRKEKKRKEKIKKIEKKKKIDYVI